MNTLNWFTKDFPDEKTYTDDKNIPGGFLIEFDMLDNSNANVLVNRHGRYRNIHLHNHDYFEIEYVLSGTVKTTIDGNKLTINEGDLIILNPYSFHDFEPLMDNDTLVNIALHRDFLPQFIDLFQIDSDLFKFIKFGRLGHSKKTNFLIYNTLGNEQVFDACIDLINNFNPSSPVNFPKARMKVCELLVLISELPYNTDHISLLDYEGQLVIDSFNYIEANLDSASLTELAESLNTTAYNLSKIFKRKTGFTFISTVQQIRLKHAYHLLNTTDLPIVEIANMIGYNNISFFYKKFKETYNLTPSQIREDLNLEN